MTDVLLTNAPFAIKHVTVFLHVFIPEGFPSPPPCFAAYLDVVQSCFQQAEVEMPPDHGILNGDYNYKGVCQ